MDIPKISEALPFLNTQQMVEVDRAMIVDYKIELVQMMENAGRNLAHFARIRFLGGNPTGKKVIVLAGTGGNGGGALVGARRLQNWGAQVQVFTSKSGEEFAPVPGHQLDTLRRMNVPIATAQAIDHAEVPDLILDGLIGYNLKGAPQGAAAELIRWANLQSAPVLALDVPSGVDATAGALSDPIIQADATLTLALPKAGLLAPGVKPFVGELYLADISVPPELYGQVIPGYTVGALFAESEIARLW